MNTIWHLHNPAEDYKTKKVADTFTPIDPENGESECLGKHTQLEADLQQLHNDLQELQWKLNNKQESPYEIAESLEAALADIEEINWLSGGNVKMFRERCDYSRKLKETCECCKLTELFEG